MNNTPLEVKASILTNLRSEVGEYSNSGLTKIVNDFFNQITFNLADAMESGYATPTQIGIEEINRVFDLVMYEIGCIDSIWESYSEFEESEKPF